MDQRQQDFVNKSDIRDLLARYFVGVDRRDWDMIGSCFTPDIHAEYHMFKADGIAELMQHIRGVARSKSSTHFMGNHLIEVKGETARSEIYCEIHMIFAEPAGDHDTVLGTRYIDQLTRVNGHWKVKHRLQYRDWGRDEYPTPQPRRLVPNPPLER